LLLAKLILLLVLTVLLSYVHFGIQPRIEALLDTVEGTEIPSNIADELRPLRGRRKKLAGFCLFFVITLVLLGMQVSVRFNLGLSAVLVLLAALPPLQQHRRDPLRILLLAPHPFFRERGTPIATDLMR